MRRRALSLAIAAAAVGCSGAPREPAPAPAAPVETKSAAPAPRYLVLHPTWIERGDDGLDRVVASGRRMEVSGLAIARLGPASPEVDGGARAPSWAAAGPARYVFWKGTKLYGAESFAGDLRPIATLPAAPRATFDWLNGTGLVLPGGALVVPSSGGAPARLGVPAVVRAMAADARRALAITAFGHAQLTADGGATFRDASADLAGASLLEVRGDRLAAVLADGRERYVSESGAVVDAGTGHVAGPARGRRPPAPPDRFPGGVAAAVTAAVQGGVPLDDGGVIVADEGVVGRFDLASLTTTSVAALDPGLASAECQAFRAADGPLLACAGDTHAALVDLRGAPRTERTFDLAGAPEIDRFIGVDGEAIGYLGPCSGRPDPAASAVDPDALGRQRSAVFCVRAARDAWTEHRLDPADAADVIAWIPRTGGGAVALVARAGTWLDDRERVTVRGALRVVRVAKSEPPFGLGASGWDPHVTLSRALRVGADDTIEGWLSVVPTNASVSAITIDPAGHARVWPGPPRAGQIVAAGRFALTQSDDGKLWETVDFGHHWAAVEPPPADADASLSWCTPVGCRLGAFARIGWSASGASPSDFAGNSAAIRERARPRPAPTAPVVRLACAFDGPPASARASESSAFGFTSSAQPRGMPVRLGSIGMAVVPYASSQLPASADVHLGWIAPLDVSGRVQRATAPLPPTPLAGKSQRFHELMLGWLLAPDGGLAVIPTSRGNLCADTLLARAGVTPPFGGCAPEPSIGVEIGGRVFVVHPTADALDVSTAPAPPRRAARSARDLAAAVALRDLGRTPGVALRDFTFGAGVRAGAPVVVAVDLRGDAALAPLDPTRGTLGPEERLRPLSEAALGSDRACAPRPDDARIVLPFQGMIGLDRAALRGVSPAAAPGVAVLRWSRDRACLDAVEIPVRDERFEESPGAYDPSGAVRKLVARFGGHAPEASLLEVSLGLEVRQKLACTAMIAGD